LLWGWQKLAQNFGTLWYFQVEDIFWRAGLTGKKTLKQFATLPHAKPSGQDRIAMGKERDR